MVALPYTVNPTWEGSDLLAGALAIASRGWPAFPCKADKKPATVNGFKDASTDPEKIKTMFSRSSAALIGVPTGKLSGLIAIDVDLHGNSDGTAWYTEHFEERPPTLMHETQNGGCHIIYRTPDGDPITNSAKKLANGVDVRGDGGYIIVPPSPGYSILDDRQPAEMPEWLAQACRARKAEPSTPLPLPTASHAASDDRIGKWARAALDGECKALGLATEGDRNQTLNTAAFKLGRHVGGGSLSRSDVEAALARVALNVGLTPGEIAKTIKSGIDAGILEPRHITEREPPAIASGRASTETPLAKAHTDFPDRVSDPWNTLEPPAFPHEALPPVLRDFTMERARIIGADPCAIAWSAISACSAAIHGGARLQMKRNDRWAVPPAIWVCLVGASSAKKTPIINATWGPIDAAQIPAFNEYKAALKRWKALSKKERDDTPQPEYPIRFTTHDSTVEKFQELLSQQDRGIGVIRDELAGFIGSMDKYAGGGNGGAVDRAFYLQAYNGGPFISDRVMRGSTLVENLLITIIGGIQPDRLAHFSDLADDGLWQRFVPIIVSPATRGQDEVIGPEVDAYRRAIEGLLTFGAERLWLSDGAHAVRHQIEGELFDLEQSDALGSKFTSFCGKMLGLFGRLALVMSCVAGEGSGSYAVSEQTARAARTLILHSVVPHAARVYTTMAGGGGDLDTTQGIAGYVLTKRLSRLLVSDLTRNVRSCRNKSLMEVQKQVSPLVAGGWLAPELPHAGNKAWTVNPAVHVTYAERAETEASRRQAVRRLILGTDEGDDGDM